MITPNEIQYKKILRSMTQVLGISEETIESVMYLFHLHILEEARVAVMSGKSTVDIHIPKICNIKMNIIHSESREDTHKYSVSVIQSFRDSVRDAIDHSDSLIRSEVESNLDELLVNKILSSIDAKYTEIGDLDISDL